MNDYTLTLMLLMFSIMGQSIAAGLALEYFAKKGLPARPRRSWFALGLASLLLALHHGYSLELAFRTGLFDLRGSVLGALIALFSFAGFLGLQIKPRATHSEIE